VSIHAIDILRQHLTKVNWVQSLNAFISKFILAHFPLDLKRFNCYPEQNLQWANQKTNQWMMKLCKTQSS